MDLSNLALQDDVVDDDRDSVGGGYLKDTGLYPVSIDMAYMSKSANGATAVNFVFKDDSGSEIRQTIYMTNRNGGTTYLGKDKLPHALPGLNKVNTIVKAACGKTIDKLKTEDKTINLYSREEKTEVPEVVPVLYKLLDKKIVIGLLRIKDNKQVLDDDNDWGDDPEGAFVEFNEIDKVFTADTHLTSKEAKAGKVKGVFIHKWKKNWDGKIKDNYEAPDGMEVELDDSAEETAELF